MWGEPEPSCRRIESRWTETEGGPPNERWKTRRKSVWREKDRRWKEELGRGPEPTENPWPHSDQEVIEEG